MFEILISDSANVELKTPRENISLKKRYNAINKTIKYLSNPRHPGLQTHEFTSLKGPRGEKVFEAYAEQNTPAAYRVFWYYGPERKQITIIAITSHP